MGGFLNELEKVLQKWRRALRSIRFRGLRVMRESQCGWLQAKKPYVPTSPSLKDHGKKRNHDEMLDHDLLDDLMNRTFSDTDNTDSTFRISKFGDISTNGSSNDGHSLSEDYQSPFKSKHSLDSSLQDTLPISASESEHQEPNMSTKSNEATFVSTVDDTEESAFALTEEESSLSLNDNSKHSERNGSQSTESTVQTNGNSKVSKESLNAPLDPLDAMMFKLVEMESSEWKIKAIKPYVPTSPDHGKKRNHDEMLDHDLLDDLMNRTFSVTDNTDSTFRISKFGDISTNGSSNDGHSLSEDYQSPFKSKHSLDSSLQDTLPISASESEHQEPNMSTKSNEATFVSTVDDTEESAFALTEEESSLSLNDNSKHSERNGSQSTESNAKTNGNSKVSKDAMMFKLVVHLFGFVFVFFFLVVFFKVFFACNSNLFLIQHINGPPPT